jgi:tRNA(fMet)-specific endonuclease VapC
VARRLILDASVFIADERASTVIASWLQPDDDVAIAAVTAAELLTGVELASKKHRPARDAYVSQVLDTVPVCVYDLIVARVHSRLLAHARRHGVARGAHDLTIAATAVATARTIVTTDVRASFAELPDVHVIVAGGPGR